MRADMKSELPLPIGRGFQRSSRLFTYLHAGLRGSQLRHSTVIMGTSLKLVTLLERCDKGVFADDEMICRNHEPCSSAPAEVCKKDERGDSKRTVAPTGSPSLSLTLGTTDAAAFLFILNVGMKTSQPLRTMFHMSSVLLSMSFLRGCYGDEQRRGTLRKRKPNLN